MHTDGPHHNGMYTTSRHVSYHQIQIYPDLNGTPVTVLGRSIIVGKPLPAELINGGATVSVCNSATLDGVRTALCQQSGHCGECHGRTKNDWISEELQMPVSN